jgi:hypothetical protein
MAATREVNTIVQCAWCRSVMRTPQNGTQSLEGPAVSISHGICAACFTELRGRRAEQATVTQPNGWDRMLTPNPGAPDPRAREARARVPTPTVGMAAWAPHGPHVWIAVEVLSLGGGVARVALIILPDGRRSKAAPRHIPIERLRVRDRRLGGKDRPRIAPRLLAPPTGTGDLPGRGPSVLEP